MKKYFRVKNYVIVRVCQCLTYARPSKERAPQDYQKFINSPKIILQANSPWSPGSSNICIQNLNKENESSLIENRFREIVIPKNNDYAHIKSAKFFILI